MSPVYTTKHVADVTPSGLVGLLQCNLCKVSEDGYLFTADDSFDAVDLLFRQQFPYLFSYLDAHIPTTGPAYDAQLSPWLICIKQAGRKPGVMVFSSDQDGPPDRNDIITALSISKRNRRNFKETTLFLGKILIYESQVIDFDFNMHIYCQ